MVISNAKYERKHIGKNQGFQFRETEIEGVSFNMDVSSFEVPRYEELKYLRLEALEE